MAILGFTVSDFAFIPRLISAIVMSFVDPYRSECDSAEWGGLVTLRSLYLSARLLFSAGDLERIATQTASALIGQDVEIQLHCPMREVSFNDSRWRWEMTCMLLIKCGWNFIDLSKRILYIKYVQSSFHSSIIFTYLFLILLQSVKTFFATKNCWNYVDVKGL